jgi:hypothetical protein
MHSALVALLLVPLSVLGLGAADAHGPAPDGSPRTTVVRPVTADGEPAPGWTVHRERGGAATCSDPAVAAVDDDIVGCYPSALYLPSCWSSTHHTVLCLRDVTEQKLVRVRYRGTIPSVTAPEQPSPQEMQLGDGQTCTQRVGGAWGTVPGHPRWVGFYSCDDGSVYGPPNGDGINRTDTGWRVRVVDADGDVTHRGVRADVLVGTAR